MNGITMSTAVGAYLKTLREHQGLSQNSVGEKLKLSGKQVYNWEKGASVPSGDAMVRLIAILGGSIQHLSQLFDEKATVEDGVLLAKRWLSEAEFEDLEKIPDERVSEALAILDEIERRDRAGLDTALRVLRALVGR